MWKLAFDDNGFIDVLWKPSASDIVEHIGMLNNHDRTFVNLECDTGQMAIFGGNNDRVMVHCTLDFELGFLMADASVAWDAGNFEISVQGQRAQYSGRYFVPKSAAIRSVLYFLKNCALDEDSFWERDQEAQLGAP